MLYGSDVFQPRFSQGSALRPERRATRERIVGVFWGDRDEERARNSLADAVSHLRRVLGRESIHVVLRRHSEFAPPPRSGFTPRATAR